LGSASHLDAVSASPLRPWLPGTAAWEPDADIGTGGRKTFSRLRIFTGRRRSIGPHAGAGLYQSGAISPHNALPWPPGSVKEKRQLFPSSTAGVSGFVYVTVHNLPPGCLRSPDQCFKTRRSLLSRSGPDARDGLSLARNGCSFRSLHSKVNVPGLPLRFQLAASSARSAFLLGYPVRLAPVWAASLLLARCSLHDLLEKPRLQPPLPFGTFASLRIKAFCWICCLSARLPTPPDFLSLPAAGFYLPGSIASSYY
jgi:hypothetical protein